MTKPVAFEVFDEVRQMRDRALKENERLRARMAALVKADEEAERYRRECQRLKAMYSDLKRINAMETQRSAQRAAADRILFGRG